MLVLFAGLHRKTDQHLLLEAGVSLNLTLIKGVKASTQVENSHCHANGGGRHVFVPLFSSCLPFHCHSFYLDGFKLSVSSALSVTSQTLSNPFRDEEQALKNRLYFLCTGFAKSHSQSCLLCTGESFILFVPIDH